MSTQPNGPEILFWGDVESTIDEDVRVEDAVDVNIKVWREAAIRWIQGRLGAVFVSARDVASCIDEYLIKIELACIARSNVLTLLTDHAI